MNVPLHPYYTYHWKDIDIKDIENLIPLLKSANVKKENDVMLVEEENDQLLGFVMSQLHKPTGKATIENIYANPSIRGKGIASSLIKQCLKQLKENGATYVCGLTKVNNEEATKFFVSVGFNKGYNFVWVDLIL